MFSFLLSVSLVFFYHITLLCFSQLTQCNIIMHRAHCTLHVLKVKKRYMNMSFRLNKNQKPRCQEKKKLKNRRKQNGNVNWARLFWLQMISFIGIVNDREKLKAKLVWNEQQGKMNEVILLRVELYMIKLAEHQLLYIISILLTLWLYDSSWFSWNSYRFKIE